MDERHGNSLELDERSEGVPEKNYELQNYSGEREKVLNTLRLQIHLISRQNFIALKNTK